MRRIREHLCGEFYCTICRRIVTEGHICYMPPVNEKTEKKLAYIFYDNECRQDEQVSGNTFLHVPNLLVTLIVSDDCIDSSPLSSPRECVLFGGPCERIPMDYVVRTGFKMITCIAHNAKGYESNFILKMALEKTNWKPDVIMSGSKILTITFSRGNLRFTH
ncbi:hypothetical protein J437_LFUL008102 [Ladona fulva]|uniref:Uncharacterized protein n=1 Tax=Ladona fulva TaxID=123851 RepID=A0A8K0K159_LADFU|nr:hypothetical protein J437_LFUL008102 [Ladona fulva]